MQCSVPIQPPDEAIATVPDQRSVMIMKFSISGLTFLQAVLMCIQFRLMSAIFREEEWLDLNLEEQGGSDSPHPNKDALNLTPRPKFALGWNAATFRLLKFILELLLCLVHPPPFFKKKIVMLVVGRLCIYSLESWVPFRPPP